MGQCHIAFYRNSVLGERLQNPSDYSFSSTRLNTRERIRLPQKETLSVEGKIFEVRK